MHDRYQVGSVKRHPRTESIYQDSIILGTSSIVDEITHHPLLSTLSSVVETVIHLRNEGHKVVLVSSGAIGVGLKRMDIASKPKRLLLPGKQVCAILMLYMSTRV